MRKLLFALLMVAGIANAQIGNYPALIGQRGTTTPSTCTIGQLFFDTDATAGRNVYGCTSANTWTLQGDGGGSSDIVIGTSVITGGTSGRVLYDNAGVAGEYTVTGTAGSVVLSASPSLTGTVSVGSSGSAGAITFGNATSGTVTLQPVTGALGTVTLSLPALTKTLTATIASGTSALGTSAISSGACATVVTTSATGTATTDVIGWGFNADPTSTTGYSASANGMLTIISYPTADNVNFKVCNNTASSITPGAVTLNWRVTR